MQNTCSAYNPYTAICSSHTAHTQPMCPTVYIPCETACADGRAEGTTVDYDSSPPWYSGEPAAGTVKDQITANKFRCSI